MRERDVPGADPALDPGRRKSRHPTAPQHPPDNVVVPVAVHAIAGTNTPRPEAGSVCSAHHALGLGLASRVVARELRRRLGRLEKVLVGEVLDQVAWVTAPREREPVHRAGGHVGARGEDEDVGTGFLRSRDGVCRPDHVDLRTARVEQRMSLIGPDHGCRVEDR